LGDSQTTVKPSYNITEMVKSA